VKSDFRVPRSVTLPFVLCLVCTLAGMARDKKGQAKPTEPQTVDSGSFGIFVNGKRVATETFAVRQQTNSSSIRSELKEIVGSDPAIQKSELEISSTGNLIRYEWSQSSGGSLTVMPNNEFLLEKISTTASAKPAEQPFLMPSSSAILDNNFFVHREILIWRYLAAACQPQGASGSLKALVPQDRSSEHVRLQLVGQEKIQVRGADRDLLRLNLKGDDFDWSLWVDEQDHFKLIRVAIPADNTEVVRD
jgi:hypothetical protein